MTAARIADDAVRHAVEAVTGRDDGAVDEEELLVGDDLVLVVAVRVVT